MRAVCSVCRDEPGAECAEPDCPWRENTRSALAGGRWQAILRTPDAPRGALALATVGASRQRDSQRLLTWACLTAAIWAGLIETAGRFTPAAAWPVVAAAALLPGLILGQWRGPVGILGVTWRLSALAVAGAGGWACLELWPRLSSVAPEAAAALPSALALVAVTATAVRVVRRPGLPTLRLAGAVVAGTVAGAFVARAGGLPGAGTMPETAAATCGLLGLIGLGGWWRYLLLPAAALGAGVVRAAAAGSEEALVRGLAGGVPVLLVAGGAALSTRLRGPTEWAGAPALAVGLLGLSLLPASDLARCGVPALLVAIGAVAVTVPGRRWEVRFPDCSAGPFAAGEVRRLAGLGLIEVDDLLAGPDGEVRAGAAGWVWGLAKEARRRN